MSGSLSPHSMTWMPRRVGAGVEDGVGEDDFVNYIGRFDFDEFGVGLGLEIGVREPGFGLDQVGVGLVDSFVGFGLD